MNRAPRVAFSSSSLLVVGIVSAVEAVHLCWEATHGGVLTHHPLAQGNLPGISNWWGLLVAPVLALWALRRWRRRNATLRAVIPGLLAGLVFGMSLSLSFQFGTAEVTNNIFTGGLIAALLLPAYFIECLLGFVLGMSWTFGAVIPLLAGGAIATISAFARLVIYRGAIFLWRRYRTKAA